MGRENVTVSKPKVGGAVAIAPSGTSLPTDATTAAGSGFTQLGYISDDGLKNSNSPDVGSVVAWGGDEVLTPAATRPDTFDFTLIEVLDPNVLKLVYGDTAVTGNITSGMSASVGTAEMEPHAMIIDMIASGNVLHRVCVPNATVVAVGEITYNDTNAAGYAVTIKASADASGKTHYEYWKKS